MVSGGHPCQRMNLDALPVSAPRGQKNLPTLPVRMDVGWALVPTREPISS